MSHLPQTLPRSPFPGGGTPDADLHEPERIRAHLQLATPLDYDVEIRTVICGTNAIESLNARYRRAVKARDHFPNGPR